jgi:hypothetical protein
VTAPRDTEETFDGWALDDFDPYPIRDSSEKLTRGDLEPDEAFETALILLGEAYGALDYHAWTWHRSGASWTKIGEKMHISRQAAWERFNGTAAQLRRGDDKRRPAPQPRLPPVC